MTARPLTREERVLLAAAHRWLRTNGWSSGPADTPEIRWTDGTWSIDWAVFIGWGAVWLDYAAGSDHGEQRLHADVTSVQAAVDHLVTAGILPPELHSIARQFVPAVESDGDTVGFWLNLAGEPEAYYLPPTWPVPDRWEPLYRRVVAS